MKEVFRDPQSAIVEPIYNSNESNRVSPQLPFSPGSQVYAKRNDPLLAPNAPRRALDPVRLWRAGDGNRRAAEWAGRGDPHALAAVAADLRAHLHPAEQ